MSTLGDSRSPSTDGMRLGSRPLLNVSIPQDSRSTEESTVTQDNQDDHNDQDESVSFIVTSSSSFIIVHHESINSRYVKLIVSCHNNRTLLDLETPDLFYLLPLAF
jgi:hypothetical protein